MEEKLKRGVSVGRRGGGPCTPSVTWKFGFPVGDDDDEFRVATIKEVPRFSTATVSARKLCANLWEIEPHLLPLAKMSNGGPRRHGFRDKGSEVGTPHEIPTHQVTPYKPAVNPSSLDIKHGISQSSYSVKTSTELLKLLNRIWSLEEQRASNKSLVKALKTELNHSRSQIKELVKEKRADRKEMDALVRKFSDYKLARRNKEQYRIKAAVESAQEELSEVKSCFSNALKELQQERKARILLEDLCDELAKGIREYEQKVRYLKHRPEKDQSSKEIPNRLVVHISEAWLDGRTQMKVGDPSEKSTIVDKLCFEIETFLRDKEFVGHTKDANSSQNEFKANCFRWHSLESFPLNEAVSAPKNADNEEDSIGSDLRFSKNSPNKFGSREIVQDHNLQSIQKRLEETERGHAVQVNGSRKFEISKAAQQDSMERNNEEVEVHRLNSRRMLENFRTNPASTLEGEKIPSKDNFKDDSHEQSMLTHHRPEDLKKITLKEKLLEARLEARQSRSIASRGSS